MKHLAMMIFGPRQQVEIFRQHLAAAGCELKLTRDFQWYVCEEPSQPLRQFQLMQAMPEHLEMVIETHASMLIEATGNPPRQIDSEGFRRRLLERIERGRTWVKVEDGQAVFKTDLQSVTPDAIYLEGIWTLPEYRGRGIAKSCVVEMTHRRLRKQQVIGLVVEPEEEAAQRIYEYARFCYQTDYQARYLQPVPEA